MAITMHCNLKGARCHVSRFGHVRGL